MQIRPDPTTSNAMLVATTCGNCGVEERRLLHNVHDGGILRRLCTTCVLRLHPQSFCPTCFQVYPPSPPNDAVLACFKCYSSSHSRCVEARPTSHPIAYICPLCLHRNTPIFKLKSAEETNVKISEAMNVRIEDCRVMDRDAAKKLFAAAKIAAMSLNKAAVAAKAEAERRAKEAAFTRKRANEALEHVARLVMKEKSRWKKVAFAGPDDVTRPEFCGIGSNGAYTAPAVGDNNVNDSNSYGNRNGSVASGSSRFNVVEEKLENAGNVDRDNSCQVGEALNVVELRGNEKMGVEITAQGEGSGVSQSDDHAPVNMNEKGRTRLNAGERNNDNSSSDQVNLSDLETSAETLDTRSEKQENKNNEGEQHSNGG